MGPTVEEILKAIFSILIAPMQGINSIEFLSWEWMEKLTQNKIIRISKIIVPNLIPVVGIIFLDWGMFEVALTYLLETFLVFLIFFFDRYFIAKRTRYPAPFALIQLFFLLLPFGGLMYMYALICFMLTEEIPNPKKSFAYFERYMDDLQLWWVLAAMLIFEVINFIIKNQNGRQHKSSSIWYNLRKLLFVHLFVIGSSFILGFIHDDFIMPLIFVICFKIILDYAIEDEEFFFKAKETLSKPLKDRKKKKI